MLLLPVSGARLDRSTRLDPLKSQCFQLLHPLLVSMNKSLEVRFDTKSLRLRTGSDLGFEFRMYRNTRGCAIFLALTLILRLPNHTLLLERRTGAQDSQLRGGCPVLGFRGRVLSLDFLFRRRKNRATSSISLPGGASLRFSGCGFLTPPPSKLRRSGAPSGAFHKNG
jgi:hypothetical protein